MKPLDKIISRAQQNPRRLVLPEGTDDRVVEAAVKANARGICKPILLGPIDLIFEKIKLHGEVPENFDVIDPTKDERLEKFAETLYQIRHQKGMTKEQAAKAAQDPIQFGAIMVRIGDADGAVAGAATSTADVVRSALQIIGRAEDVNTVSSFFLMLLCEPHHEKKGAIFFADCGLVIEPSTAELADIAANTAASFKSLLNMEPKVAMLSFSTNGSAKHPRVDKVREAVTILTEQHPNLIVDGDLQFDAAFVPEVSAAKSRSSIVKGDANVMVFPNLDAANIGYKIAQRIGGATAVGPILQGLKRPMNDLSRGCSADDIVNLMAITCVQAN